MRFETQLLPDQDAILRALGYGATAPDDETRRRLATAASEVARAVRPRWVARVFPLAGGPLRLAGPGPGLPLPGVDIAAHLAGCTQGVLLAVTLGDGVERTTRAAEAADMATAVLVDAAASTLAEQYADEAERLLRAQMVGQGLHLTGRFSPGYGDFPIALQRDVLRLVDAPRQIGLTAAASGILLPRKSITAVLGAAHHPVTGRPAGCAHCALKDKCETRKQGGHCANNFCEGPLYHFGRRHGHPAAGGGPGPRPAAGGLWPAIS